MTCAGVAATQLDRHHAEAARGNLVQQGRGHVPGRGGDDGAVAGSARSMSSRPVARDDLDVADVKRRQVGPALGGQVRDQLDAGNLAFRADQPCHDGREPSRAGTDFQHGLAPFSPADAAGQGRSSAASWKREAARLPRPRVASRRCCRCRAGPTPGRRHVACSDARCRSRKRTSVNGRKLLPASLLTGGWPPLVRHRSYAAGNQFP